MGTWRLRSVAAGLGVLALLTACGQKPGVHIAGAGGGATGDLNAGGTTGVDPAAGTTGDLSAGGATTGDPSAAGTTTSDVSTSGGTTTTGGGGGTTTTGGGGTTGDGSTGGGTTGGTTGGSSGSGGSQTPQGSDRTGVTDEKITLGLHAPVTGAAPLPVTSFEKSGDLYYRWHVDQGGTFLGRTEIELLFRDDKYDPSSAIQVCRELASKAFALAGGGGTDQIQACGRYADQANVPYFSAGVTEAGLKGLDWYFASSMSYRAQGVILAQMVKKRFGDKKIAAIITNTPNFDDAVQGWEQGVQEQGLDYYKTLRHPKGDSSWYNSYGSELKSAGVEVVYMLTAPVDYIRFAQQGTNQGFTPQYVGVGVSMGLNAVLGSGCPHVDKGIFFSPFPGLDWARDNVPEFFETGEKYGAPTDDIALALWGTAQVNHLLLERYGQVYGNDLTREDFRNVVEQQQGVQGEVFPELNYSPQNHFGSNQVHVLQADCSNEEHATLGTFVSGF